MAPTTSTTIGSMSMIGAIAGAYSAYEAGKMRQLAYEHEAAVAELNAKQIKIAGMFTIADKKTELANTLALQNVISAASGRAGGGSLQSLAATSEAEFAKEAERIKVTGRAREVATLMDSEAKRAAGKSAAQHGLLSGIVSGTTGVTKSLGYIL